MMHVRASTDVEADLLALKRAAERAGTALACLFSCAAEYEAELVRTRRAQGAYDNLPAIRPLWRTASLTATLSLVFLML